MRNRAFLVAVASVLVAGCSVLGNNSTAPSATGSPSSSVASPSPTWVATQSTATDKIPAPTWSPPPVPTIPGHRVYKVSEAISARDAGELGSQTFDLGGYWSDNPLLMSCP